MNEILKGISTKKKIVMVLCVMVAVAAIVATTVFVTVAYLTSSAAVSNVFTIGKVGITMNESHVNPDGTLHEDKQRVDTNVYHLVPNKTYIKDPVITVDAGSEDSYLFVLVRNDLETIEDTHDPVNKPTIAKQLADNGWQRYIKASTGWVYVYVGTPVDPASVIDASTNDGVKFVSPGTYALFKTFSIDEHADVSAFGAAKITLTAVAIQHDGFNSVSAAWEAVIETYPYIHTGNVAG